MEKTNTAIIDEIKGSISSLKRELENIEKKLAELEFTESDYAEKAIPDQITEDMPDLEPFDIMLDTDQDPVAEVAPEPKIEEEEDFAPEPLKRETPVKTIFESVIPSSMPWKRDIPGSPVQNILSAISLNDRVLFINTLFEGDPILFQDTLKIFNQSSSLSEIERYIVDNFPNWDMSSDIVYRFMMAIRRKIN